MKSLLHPKGHFLAFRELIGLLTRHRQLTWEMAKREISDRYVGQVFGVLWSLGHPLILMMVYVFIFGFVFKVKVGGTADMPLNYTTYLLSGLIPWLAFSEAMSKASTVIVGNANLVKQVVFPIEVLPVKGVLASLLNQVIFTVLLMVYVLSYHHVLPWTYILIPLLILMEMLAMIGASYVLSAIGVYFRDIKDFVQVFCVVGIYLMPIFYLPDQVPALFRPILYLNPFSYLGWCFQDACYFGRFAHPWAWVVFFVMSLSIFILGYRVFRRLKVMFGNVL